MLGNLDGQARQSFFEHIRRLPPWSGHPVLEGQTDYQKLIPWVLHADGAQFYRDDEMFVWSISSGFGNKGIIKDVLLLKYPIAIIPERLMRDHEVLWLSVRPRSEFS